MKPQNHKSTPHYKLNNNGARALICGVIEQAVADFKALAAAGRIVNGKVMPGNGKRIPNYQTDPEVQALLDFFTSGVMDQWIFPPESELTQTSSAKNSEFPMKSPAHSPQSGVSRFPRLRIAG